MRVTQAQLEHAIAVANFKIMLGTISLYKQILAERRKLEREFYANRTPQLERSIRLCAEKMELLRTNERFHGLSLAKFASMLKHAETR